MKAKKYRGNQRIMLPEKLHNDDIKGNSRNDLEIKQFKNTKDLDIDRITYSISLLFSFLLTTPKFSRT